MVNVLFLLSYQITIGIMYVNEVLPLRTLV